MKYRTFIVITLLLLVLNLEAQDKKNLIVYFSRVGITDFSDEIDVVTSASLRPGLSGLVGNTELLASKIQSRVGGDVVQVKTVQKYPEEYRTTTDFALKEQEKGIRPELSTSIDITGYDVIFLGYPNWWGTIPMAIVTFMEQNDFTGKTIVPFCTHEGSGLGRSIKDLKKLSPNSEIVTGLAIRGSKVDRADKYIEEWLSGLQYVQ